MVLLQLSTAAGEQLSTAMPEEESLSILILALTLFVPYYSLALLLLLLLLLSLADRPPGLCGGGSLHSNLFNISFAALKRSILSYSSPNSTSAVGPLSFHGRQIAISYKHIWGRGQNNISFHWFSFHGLIKARHRQDIGGCLPETWTQSKLSRSTNLNC